MLKPLKKILSRNERLMKAGELGLATQVEFENLLDEIATFRLHKTSEYGEYYISDVRDSFDLITGIYANFTRKFVRLRPLIENYLLEKYFRQMTNVELKDVADSNLKESLEDLFADFSIFAIYGLQFLRKIEGEIK